MTRGRAGGLAAIALVAASAGCRSDAQPAASATGSAAPAAAAAARASAVDAAPRPPSRYATDPRFRVAALEDPLQRARLAEAEGAAGLLEALDDGGEVAAAALLALPYADDADIALQPLGERALDATRGGDGGGAAPSLLQALLEIAGRPQRPREPLDPEGARAAAAAVLEIARRRHLAPAARALAISAARAMAERGLVEPIEIPTDLDPAGP